MGTITFSETTLKFWKHAAKNGLTVVPKYAFQIFLQWLLGYLLVYSYPFGFWNQPWKQVKYWLIWKKLERLKKNCFIKLAAYLFSKNLSIFLQNFYQNVGILYHLNYFQVFNFFYKSVFVDLGKIKTW